MQPVFHPINTVENIVKQSLPPFQVYDSLKNAYPLIQTYENARSQGKSVWESISSANDHARKQDAAAQAVDQAIADYKKNPTQTTAKILTQVAGTVAMLAAGGSGATAEADVPLVTRAAETEAPIAETEAETSAAAPKPGIIKQVTQGEKVAQPGTQGAVREAVQTSVKAANEATTAREAVQPKVQVPDEYKDLVNEAMNQEPAWTPEKAQPVVKALGDNFEVRGSVGEGKVTNNDLDIYQKTGKLSDASDKLTDLGFKRAYETDHGEVWTNDKTGQNVDLWDAQHEPKPGFGPDQTPESEPELPIANKKSPAVSANAPLVKGNTTIIDDHLDTLEANEKATYKRMDETAGFDVKALKDKLSTDKYNLKQLGSSDPDKTGRLVEAINDATDRIAEANEKMKAAGIDPDEADVLHKQRMAGEDFKKVLTKYTNADGSVNVKGLLRGSKQLRFSKYGDRLEQFFGSPDAADKFINRLDAMNKLGTQAMKKQAFAKQLLWSVLPTAALATAGYETLKH